MNPIKPHSVRRRIPITVLMAGFGLGLATWTPATFAQTPSPLAEWQYASGVALEPYFETTPPVWQVQLGAGTGLQPRYEGAGRYYVQPDPLIEVRYRDTAFFSLGEGLGVNLLSRKGERAGVALTYDLGRRADDDPQLRGMGKVSPAPELKLFEEYVVYPVVLRADVRHAFGGYEGWVGDLSAYLPVIGNEKFFVLAGPTLTLVSDEFAQHYFSVTPAQSAASGHPVYDAAGGIKDVSFGITASWMFSEHWSVDGLAAAERILGSPAHSPLVETPLQYTISAYLAYSFQ